MSMDMDDPQDHQSEADHHSAANRRRLSGPGLRTFARIADLWSLDEDQRCLVLGLPDRPTYQAWLMAAREHRDLELSVDVLMRGSAVLGIHQALGTLHVEERDGVAWLRGANSAVPFDGRAPLDLMLAGTLDSLLTVRRFLDALVSGQEVEPNEVNRNFRLYTGTDIIIS